MWFVPGSHKKPVRKHIQAGSGMHQGKGALECEDVIPETEGTAVPIRAGSCTFHHGGTLHYSRGNKTDGQRRGLITNYRNVAMVNFERNKGFDHGRTLNERTVKSDSAK